MALVTARLIAVISSRVSSAIEQRFVNSAISLFRLCSDAGNPYRSVAFMPNLASADSAEITPGEAFASHKIRNS